MAQLGDGCGSGEGAPWDEECMGAGTAVSSKGPVALLTGGGASQRAPRVLGQCSVSLVEETPEGPVGIPLLWQSRVASLRSPGTTRTCLARCSRFSLFWGSGSG